MSKSVPNVRVNPRPATTSLVVLTALGFASALWALFLWAQLLIARAGGSTFCNAGEGSNCVAIWDSSFASAVHAYTGIPVAGWGLIWSLAAALLPLWALKRQADDQPAQATLGAIKLTAVGGIVSVIVFLIISANVGQLCIGCSVTYVLVGIYAAITLWGWRRIAFGALPAAGGRALGLTVVAYLLLLYPGFSTPKSMSSVSNAMISATGHQGKETGKQSGDTAATSATATAQAHSESRPKNPHASGPAANAADGVEGSDNEQKLATLLKQLPPQYLQLLADARRDYRQAPAIAREPRALVGPADATVRLVDFTDVLCGHCANFHQALTEMKKQVTPGTLAVESRHFPLDGACNPSINQKSPGESVRCTGAKAQICLEGHESASDFSGALLSNQSSLTMDKIYQLAAPYMARDALSACVAAPETAAKLKEDIAYAEEHDIHGTPLVLINGKKANQFPLFVYAMVLAGGNPDHAAFADLPAPRPPKPHNHPH